MVRSCRELNLVSRPASFLSFRPSLKPIEALVRLRDSVALREITSPLSPIPLPFPLPPYPLPLSTHATQTSQTNCQTITHFRTWFLRNVFADPLRCLKEVWYFLNFSSIWHGTFLFTLAELERQVCLHSLIGSLTNAHDFTPFSQTPLNTNTLLLRPERKPLLFLTFSLRDGPLAIRIV